MKKGNNFRDLSNTKVDNVLILECLDEKTKWGSYIWKCKCLLCGNIFNRESGNLHWAIKQKKNSSCIDCRNKTASIKGGRASANKRRQTNLSVLLEDSNLCYYLAGVIAADGCVKTYRSGERNWLRYSMLNYIVQKQRHILLKVALLLVACLIH